MTAKTETLLAFPSQSGLNSNAPGTYLAPDELAIAENITYGLNGERKKRLGFARYNTTAMGFFNVTALADFWRYGTSLTPTQKFVATAGGQIWSSPGDGNWTSIGNFSADNSRNTNITIAGGYAIFSDGVNIPKRWDQTTLEDLDVTAPIHLASTYHLRRLFAIGIPGNPSGFQVSVGGDVTAWTGADTLTADLDNDDGDALIGISRTFHKRLYFFKGPNFGSIHELSGNTLSTFQRDKVFEGLPVHNHKAIITTPNDIFWLSHAGVHSLITTQQYGDTQAAFLSKPIQNIFRNELAPSAIQNAVGFWNPLLGLVGWFITPSGDFENKWCLLYHYLISDPTPSGKKYWSVWKLSGISAYSAAVMIAPSSDTVRAGQPQLYIGGTGNGIVYAGDQSVLNDDTAPYTARVKTGINLTVGSKGPMQEMQFYGVSTFFNPVGNYDHTVNVTVDNRAQQFQISMTGLGDVLG